MEKSFNFTVKKINEIEVKERAFFYDTQVKGLAIRVSPNGKKVFYLYKYIKKPIKIKIGNFPEITIFLARQEALKILGEFAKGFNRLDAQTTKERFNTVSYFFNKYMKFQGAELAKSSIEKYNRIYDKHLKDLKNKKLIDLSFSDVEKLQYNVKKSAGPYAANQSITLLSTLINYAIKTGLRVHNPCKAIKKFKEERRERYLNLEEVRALIKACNNKKIKCSEVVKDYIIFLLLTGVRRRTAASALLKEIDFKKNLWNVPKEKTKTNQAQKIYLYGKALNIAKKAKKNKQKFLFPGSGKSGHLEEPKKGFKLLLKEAKINKYGVTIHTLRHTFITHCYEAGINPLVVSKLGGHKIPGVTANVYGHVSDEKIKEAFQIIADRFFN